MASNSNTQETKRVYGLKTAASFVVSSMIGVGVFASLGYQVVSTDTVFSIMLLWALGGLSAFTGAMSYIALASILPRSGGEYHYLSKIYGPIWGFMTGLLTVLVGFCAPIAASTMAFDSFASNILPLTFGSPYTLWDISISPYSFWGIIIGPHSLDMTIGPYSFWSIGSLIIITLIHFLDVKKGGDFNLFMTLLKVALIIVFIFAGFFFANPQPISLMPQARDAQLIMSSGFGVSLVYVTYSYTGWNAAVYILDEIKNPKRNILLSILLGTGIVMVIYMLLNFVFLYTTPMSEMAGQTDVAAVVAKNIFGESGAKIISGLIAFGLVSTISSMIVSSSRVMKRIGEDYPLFSIFGKTNTQGVPQAALLLMAGLSMFFILTFTFDAVIEYAGFILSFFGLMTVLGLFLLKFRNPEIEFPFGKWFYPIVPAIYLIIKILIIAYLIVDNPYRIVHAIITFGLAFGLYLLTQYAQHENRTPQ